MKNPLKKVFKKPDLKTQMYDELKKIGKKLDKELAGDKFNKEVAAQKKARRDEKSRHLRPAPRLV